MLTCKEMTELVTDFLEGRLPPGRWLKFQMHVGLCRHCRAYLRQMRLVVRTMSALAADPIPDHVHDALMKHFADWKP